MAAIYTTQLIFWLTVFRFVCGGLHTGLTLSLRMCVCVCVCVSVCVCVGVLSAFGTP